MAYAQNSLLLDPSKKVMILDGCFRSQLKTMKERPNFIDPTHRLRLNINKSELVKDVHMDFLKAGANVIRTNTYWASEPYITRNFKCSVNNCVDIIEEGVNAAGEAINKFIKENPKCAGEKYFILGSCGSATNTCQLTTNELKEDKIIDVHRLRVQTLKRLKVDAVAFESIETREEAFAIVKLMREHPESKVWMSFRNRDFWFDIRNGEDISKTIQHCLNSLQSQIIAIGMNCIDVYNVKNYVSQFKGYLNYGNIVPIAVCPKVKGIYKRLDALKKPNDSTEPLNFYGTYPVLEWTKRGASYIGGCCNMISQDIDSISSIIKGRNQLSSN